MAERLSDEFGTGFSERNLRNMRKFYLEYQDRYVQIRQMPSAKSTEPTQLEPPFLLSWSQYVLLMGIKDMGARCRNLPGSSTRGYMSDWR